MYISTKCSIALHCLVFICEYGGSHKVTSELLSRSSGVSAVTVRNILGALKKDGVISVRAGTGGAALLLPPRAVTLYRVWRAVEPDFLEKLIGVHQSPSRRCPVGRNIRSVLERSYGRIRDDLRRSLESVTLEDLAEDYRAFLSAERTD